MAKPVPMEVFAKLLRVEYLHEQAAKLRNDLARGLVVRYLNQENPEGGNPLGTVDVREYVALRRAYEKAAKEGVGVFRFKEHDLLVPYAYYLLEYLHPMAVDMGVAGLYQYRGPVKRPEIKEESNDGQDKG